MINIAVVFQVPHSSKCGNLMSKLNLFPSLVTVDSSNPTVAVMLVAIWLFLKWYTSILEAGQKSIMRLVLLHGCMLDEAPKKACSGDWGLEILIEVAFESILVVFVITAQEPMPETLRVLDGRLVHGGMNLIFSAHVSEIRSFAGYFQVPSSSLHHTL